MLSTLRVADADAVGVDQTVDNWDAPEGERHGLNLVTN